MPTQKAKSSKQAEVKSIPIVCPYCGVGCNLELTLDAEQLPTKSTCAGRNPELNDRYLCIKGLSVHETLTSKARLTAPLVRKAGKFEEVPWDEAIDRASHGLQEIIAKYGPESVGLLCSGKICNEEAYLAQKFQRSVIGNNHIDNCARLCHGPSEVALRKQLGFGAVSTFLEDFEHTQTVVIVGAHTLATYPVIWLRLRKRVRKGQAHLILADPRSTDLAKFATIHLQPRPGTDIYWIKALAKTILSKDWIDLEFCTRHTIGFEAYLQSLKDVDIAEACAKTGVSTADLEKTAKMIHSQRTLFIWGMGLTQHAHGTDNVSALINLALLTGNLGKPGCGVAPLRGQNNVQGASDMGALPNILPGHMHLGDEAARIHLGAIWHATPPADPGFSAPEMIHHIADGKIRALYIIGENPVMSEPQSSFVAWMMQRLELLIVQDIFTTETSQYAHIVFPATAVGEKEGTYTNAARRIQWTSGGVRSPGSAKPDWWILQALSQAMGRDWNYDSPEMIWNEIRRVIPIFGGASYDRLKGSGGLFWPCYDESHPGTPRLYSDGFAFRDRRARFIPCYPPQHLMVSTEEYPFVLITGRLLGHFNTGTMSRRSKRLIKNTPASFLAMHPQDAESLGLMEGDRLQVTSPYGQVCSHLKVSQSLSPGYLFAPNHFSTPNFNVLMSSVPLDPQARMPALKVVPVQVAPAPLTETDAS
jgi:formate dehydrogenase alpha subunit